MSERFLQKKIIAVASFMTAASLAMSACGPRNDQSPTAWNDPSLGGGKSDRGLTSLRLALDFKHDPDGSIRMETCYNAEGKFRVISEEISPRPGFLVDKTFPHKTNTCYTVWPVSPIDEGDHEVVYLGLGNNDAELSVSERVRMYDVKRPSKNSIEVKPLESKPGSLSAPGTLKMRDATQ